MTNNSSIEYTALTSEHEITFFYVSLIYHYTDPNRHIYEELVFSLSRSNRVRVQGTVHYVNFVTSAKPCFIADSFL